MRCLACNKILSDYESSRGIFMNGVKTYLDMCVRCDATPPEEVHDNLELLDHEFDDTLDDIPDDDFPDLYEEARL